MHHLTKLFRLLEITRAQPQYGYVLAEIPKSDLSDLAQHHYLVTFIAWQLARLLKREGIELDVERVLEVSMVHDLGELFGSDIAMPYAAANPAAREQAKKFEAENLSYIAKLFADDAMHFQELAAEAMNPTSLEAVVAKIADYIEVTHYKLYVHRMSAKDVAMAINRMQSLFDAMPDKKAAGVLAAFIADWQKDLGDGRLEEIFETSKN